MIIPRPVSLWGTGRETPERDLPGYKCDRAAGGTDQRRMDKRVESWRDLLAWTQKRPKITKFCFKVTSIESSSADIILEEE
jgi:hypothetical protein